MDGGYSGNPTLFPLFVPELANGLVAVHISPLHRYILPPSRQDILINVNDVNFNPSLLREPGAVAFLKEMVSVENTDAAR